MIIEGDVAQVDSYGTVISLADPAGDGGSAVTPSLNFNRWFLRRVDGSWKITGCVAGASGNRHRCSARSRSARPEPAADGDLQGTLMPLTVLHTTTEAIGRAPGGRKSR